MGSSGVFGPVVGHPDCLQAGRDHHRAMLLRIILLSLYSAVALGLSEPLLGLGDTCNQFSAACGVAMSECITYRCKCVEGWVASGDKCVPQATLPLGATCRHLGQRCQDENSECRAYRCFCKSEYTQSEDGTTCMGSESGEDFLEASACEHDTLNIDCPAGKIISVSSAMYGRLQPGHEKCPHNKIKNLTCTSSYSMEQVTESCEGKRSCAVNASNLVFADPCKGTYKYLDVSYTCEPVLGLGAQCSATSPKCNPKRTRCIDGTCQCKNDRFVPNSDGSGCDRCRYHKTEWSECEDVYDGKTRKLTLKEGQPEACPKEINRSRKCHNKKITRCEHKSVKLECPAGRAISVDAANYGRTVSGAEKCQHEKIQTTQCESANSLPIMTEQCYGKRSCEVQAENSVFGDPCVNTFKYLDVRYTREPEREDFVTTTTCEGQKLSLECPEGEVIMVNSSNYGRLLSGEEMCPHNSIWDHECRAQNSLEIVTDKCDGKNSCDVKAKNKVFGDPCRYTYKYLEVSHACVAESMYTAIRGQTA